nr:hypothetical protein [Mesorhizobium sp. LCM 4577]
MWRPVSAAPSLPLTAHGGRLTGTLGIAFAGSQVGGSAGLQFSW